MNHMLATRDMLATPDLATIADGAAITDMAALLALFTDPATAAARACQVRAIGFGARIWVRPAPSHPLPALAGIVRGADFIDLSGPPGLSSGENGPVPSDLSLQTSPPAPSDLSLAPAWPDPVTLQPGDRLILRVEHDQLPAYCAWLVRAAAAATEWTLTPFCASPGGLFRLHLIAAARLALPPRVRVEVRHDLHGVRLAQVALGFGADTLAGPLDASRHLPLAGVPRPSETSAVALAELVHQAGLEATPHQETQP